MPPKKATLSRLKKELESLPEKGPGLDTEEGFAAFDQLATMKNRMVALETRLEQQSLESLQPPSMEKLIAMESRLGQLQQESAASLAKAASQEASMQDRMKAMEARLEQLQQKSATAQEASMHESMKAMEHRLEQLQQKSAAALAKAASQEAAMQESLKAMEARLESLQATSVTTLAKIATLEKTGNHPMVNPSPVENPGIPMTPQEFLFRLWFSPALFFGMLQQGGERKK